jgi:predicted RNA methylase
MQDMGFISEMTNVIEPAAGAGVFLDVLKDYVDDSYIHGYDLDPKRDDIEYNDFLTGELNFNRPEVVILTNPPYGKKAKLAIEFINKALDIADVVGFIVPLTLSTSWTAQKKCKRRCRVSI